MKNDFNQLNGFSHTEASFSEEKGGISSLSVDTPAVESVTEAAGPAPKESWLQPFVVDGHEEDGTPVYRRTWYGWALMGFEDVRRICGAAWAEALRLCGLAFAVAVGVSIGSAAGDQKPTVINLAMPKQGETVTVTNKPCGCGQTPTPIAGGPTPTPIVSSDVPKKPLVPVPVVPVEAVFRKL